MAITLKTLIEVAPFDSKTEEEIQQVRGEIEKYLHQPRQKPPTNE